jgi:hypothetical protein
MAFEAEDIDLVMSNETRNRYFTVAGSTLKPKRSSAQACHRRRHRRRPRAALAAMFASARRSSMPGVGLVIAGPIAAALAGAGVARRPAGSSGAGRMASSRIAPG